MTRLPDSQAEPLTAGDQRETRAVAGFWLIALTLGLFLAAASAPSPLYGVYAARWHFSSTTLTAIFAVYAVALLATLLTAGSLSDSIGRRPVIIAGLALQALSMGLFLAADGTGWLYGAWRAELIATIYVVAYLAFALPAVLAGVLTEHAGLRKTTMGYSVVVAILAIAAIVADRIRAGRVPRSPWTGRAELIGVPFDGMGRAGGMAAAR